MRLGGEVHFLAGLQNNKQKQPGQIGKLQFSPDRRPLVDL